uniref:Envelopment polyprotein n=1 Tax=Wolkberg virus TaxID=1867943 RepID=A0A1Y9T5C0_9VIRU|nr:glycoprotein [Wolkberg virus]
MNFKLLIIILITAGSNQNPIYSKCFTDGDTIQKLKMNHGVAELCMRDDISLFKITSEQLNNETGAVYLNEATRKFIISDWHDCRPRKTLGGNINILDLDDGMVAKLITYSCTNDCLISLDKEHGQVVLHTTGLNRYELTGTTTVSGWFKTKTHINLYQTCEHVKVVCGTKSLQFHACFKRHMSCIRSIHQVLLPNFIAVSICENLELIILLSLILLIFGILNILMKTYLCYLMLPVFIPVAYIYGYCYNKRSRPCKSCGLAKHPFTKCTTHCVCGARFETSDRMRIHRESGLCQGYKSMSAARILCKSKGSASILAIILALLILSFVTPINAYNSIKKIQNNTDLVLKYYRLEENMSIFEKMLQKLLNNTIISFVITILTIGTLLNCKYMLISLWVRRCQYCNLFHKNASNKEGLETRYCYHCSCGYKESAFDFHQTNIKCTSKFRIRNIMTALCIISMLHLVSNSIILIEASKQCCEKQIQSIECIQSLQDQTCRSTEEAIKYLKESNCLHPIEEKWVKESSLGDLKYLDFATKFDNYHALYIAEKLWNSKHCTYYTKLDTNTDPIQLPWRMKIQTLHPIFCVNNKLPNICKCFALSWADCKLSDEHLKEFKGYVQSNAVLAKKDTDYLVQLFLEIFPGTTSSYFLNGLRSSDRDDVNQLLRKLIIKFQQNRMLQTVLLSIEALINETSIVFSENDFNLYYKMKNSVDTRETFVKWNKTEPSEEKVKCNGQLFKYACKTNMGTQIMFDSVICEEPSKDVGIYDSTNTRYFKVSQSYCVNDKYCIGKFKPLNKEQLAQIKNLNCYMQDYKEDEGSFYTKTISKCKVKKFGYGLMKSKKTELILCDNNHIYPVGAESSHSDDVMIGVHCLTKECAGEKYAIHQSNLEDIQWYEPSVKSYKPTVHEHNTIAEYEKAILDSIQEDFQIHNFKPTKNLPHIVPQYRYITLRGIETDEGLEESYIDFEIPALSGSALGFNIIAKDSKETLFNVIVHVNIAKRVGTYALSYKTGPTININVEHNEKCTGSCPVNITTKSDWLTFSKEHSSQWGCEEFGCLAINEGCVYGSCQDILKLESKIMKKSGSESTTVEVCISLPSNNYCTQVSSIEAVYTKHFEAQLIRQDYDDMPNLVLVKSHKVYFGAINSLGNFAKGCGSVQQTRDKLMGAGVVKFDYLCHAASRKEIIIRKCYDNYYESCQALDEWKGGVMDDNEDKVILEENKKLMGSIKIKFKMGDVKYKTFTKEANFDVGGKCIGCINCMEGIICSLDILVENRIVCPISTSCKLFYDTLLLEPAIKDYHIKMICYSDKDPEIKFKICKKDFRIKITYTKGSDSIDINHGDQTAYIDEVDNRCGTWLCKAYDQGFSGLFDGFFSWFGTASKVVIGILIFIIGLLILKYAVIPIAKLIAILLQRHEKEYQLENKIK